MIQIINQIMIYRESSIHFEKLIFDEKYLGPDEAS